MAPSFVFPRVILHAKDFSSATQKKKSMKMLFQYTERERKLRNAQLLTQ